MQQDDVKARLDELLSYRSPKGTSKPLVLAGRPVHRTDAVLHLAVATGVVEVPLDCIEDLAAFGDSGHVRIQVSQPERITPIGSPGRGPAPIGGPGRGPAPIGGPRGPLPDPQFGGFSGFGQMSDGTYTKICEDTGTITYGITADATDDSWCGDDLDDWE